MAETGEVYDLAILRRIMRYARPYRVIFGLAVLVTVVLAAVSPLRPWLIQYTFDHFVAVKVPDPAGLLHMILLLIGLLIFEGIVQFINSYTTTWLGQTIIKDLRTQLYEHILSLKLQYFDKTPIGTLVTRSVSDIETISDVFSQGLIVIIGDLLKIVAIVSVMFYTSVSLSLIALLTIPLLLISTYIFKNAIKSAFQDVRTQISRLNAFVQEHISGVSLIQVFNREKQEMDKFNAINEKYKDANVRSVWYYSIFFPVVDILSSISLALIVWWGGRGILHTSVTFGEVTAFIMYINMLFRPIRMLADRFNTLQMGMVSSERVFKVLDTEEVIENKGAVDNMDVNGIIEFKHVWLAYNKDEWVLKDISFKVDKAQTVALVGATGAGKSSIINLLGRYYEYNKGSITLDDVEIRDYTLEALRRNIGIVLQDVFLFSDSIANNISLNNPAISRERIIEASKIVGAHDFIMQLPDNYDYNVMERGAMLSVGQRQLIAFIRAYVYNPRILVLDEATSSIDTESEKLIQYATDKLTEGRTSIIIAHRLATIQKADKILVLDHGEIIESGNHQELLKLNGIYKNLYELQFKDEKKISI